ncbi:HAMP domain-containing protein [Xylanibacillus composti]|uniref:Methyl-accepting chemotaxis protein n=1 Tax=Xylanibacillus composti TaxID=1572762 RepID=A0A8J4H2H6_9BACL|nr:HAMP domain-containing methyl-accepting chemotaxis protein [Xylanibacillus composti]MDT9723538.1 HAMP domain-containing protein [Xylanibacillus composti]GIQ68425.1 hypothetical protein XYCOK13_12490 [Xylanibacillus composti]
MNKLRVLSFKHKLQLGFYSIVGVFSLALLIVVLASDFSLMVGIATIVVLIIASYPFISFLERALTSPINEISKVAMSVSKGDFTERVRYQSNDALGELATSFNKMMEKLKDILHESSSISKTVADTSRDIYQKNQSLRDVIDQVNVSTNELATGATAISEDVGEISTSIHDIEDKVKHYAKSTQEMNQRSEHTLALVEKGKEAVESQSAGMKQNVEATAAVSETVSQLALQAQDIQKITKTISEIAEQTNLLSLNASIEAARAGEHGLGFAVVAQEVRMLADQSTASTKEVFQLVASIEQGIAQAISNIQQNEAVVSRQNDLIRETETVFEQIVEGIRYISEEIASFAQESSWMSEAAQRISASMENISSITQQSAAGTEEVSAAMNEQIAAVQAVVEQSEQMAALATRLQRTIQVFKF